MLSQMPYMAQFAPACNSADSHSYSASTIVSSAGPKGGEANGNYNLNIIRHLQGEERMFTPSHPQLQHIPQAKASFA